MSTLYHIERLAHFYEKHPALDIRHLPTLDIEQGQVLALTGANGAGKSTFLRLLAFLEKPSTGHIHFYGKNTANPRLEATLLLQEPYIFKQSVLENVCYGLRLRGHTTNMLSKAEQSLLAVGFTDENILSRQWHQLSGGEKQRVALAARLVLQPSALLLDEPTAHVDGASAIAIQKAVNKAIYSGTTVIVASHDMPWLESLAPQYLHLG